MKRLTTLWTAFVAVCLLALLAITSSCSTPRSPQDFEALAKTDPCAASWNLRYERLVGDSCYRKRLTQAAQAGCKADGSDRDAAACKVARMLERTGPAARSTSDDTRFDQALLAGCDAGDGDGCALLGRLRLNESDDTASARKLFERGCEQGSAASCFELESLQGEGPTEANPTEANPTEANKQACAEDDAKCHQAACRRGQPSACTRLAALLEQKDAPERDLGRAFGSYERACAMGDWNGCGELGRFYEQGLVVPRDYAVARKLYQWACVPTEPAVCVAAGRMFAEGLGGSSDEELARSMFVSACDSGDATGCRNAADLLVHDAEDRAEQLFTKACQLGDGQSCVRLAHLQLDDRPGGTSTKARSIDQRVAELFHGACDAGYADGCKQGAGRFESGDGVSTDEKVAAELAAKACRLGSSTHCWGAADAYRFGYGVETDHSLAKTLIESAIEGYRKECHKDSGDSRSCMNAAHALAHGYPEKKRLEEARSLLKKACEDGAEDACREIAFQQVTGEIFAVDRDRGIASMTQICDDGDYFVCSRLADEFTLGAQSEGELGRAFDLYFRACYWRGESRACAAHGLQLLRGQGPQKDFDEAYRHASRACTEDDAVGCPVAAQATLRSAEDKSPEEKTSIEEFAEKLENLCVYEGKDAACTPLARLYETGLGVKRDTYRALSLYERVCDADAFYSPEACSRAKLVHVSHEFADEKESSGAKRAKALQKACKEGDAARCVLLARQQEFGSLDSDRFDDAAASYRRACELGNSDACTVYIATAYEEGTLWGPKFREELEWACEEGTASMCSKWGRTMGSHRWELAVKLNQQACQKGLDDACRFLQVNLEAREARKDD